jgi:hypothetical protein
VVNRNVLPEKSRPEAKAQEESSPEGGPLRAVAVNESSTSFSPWRVSRCSNALFLIRKRLATAWPTSHAAFRDQNHRNGPAL